MEHVQSFATQKAKAEVLLRARAQGAHYTEPDEVGQRQVNLAVWQLLRFSAGISRSMNHRAIAASQKETTCQPIDRDMATDKTVRSESEQRANESVTVSSGDT